MNVLDLFSGIGGFSLGLERAGMRTVAFCEVDPFCRRILAKHWPGIPIHEDVRNLQGEDVGPVDVICGGFPCQPFSVAGRRRSTTDPRNMVSPMLRLVGEIKSAWLVFENVKGFVDTGMDSLCDELDRLGYTTWTIGAPACATGLPSMEWHLWIIASTSSERLERCGQIALQIIEDGTQELQGSDPRGLDRWHLSSSRVCGVGERVPNRVDRLRALGNAVDPCFPEIIGRAIMKSQDPATWK